MQQLYIVLQQHVGQLLPAASYVRASRNSWWRQTEESQNCLSQRAQNVIKSTYLHSALQRKTAAFINKIATWLRELSITLWLFKSSLCEAFWHRIQSFLSHHFQRAFRSICQCKSSCWMPCNKVTKIFSSFKIKNPIKPEPPGLDCCHHLTAAQQWDKLQVIPSLRRDSSQPGSQKKEHSLTVITLCCSVMFHPMWWHPNRPWHCAGARSGPSKSKLLLQAAGTMWIAQGTWVPVGWNGQTSTALRAPGLLSHLPAKILRSSALWACSRL